MVQRLTFWTVRAVRWATPWLIRFSLAAAHLLLQAAVSWWTGVLNAVRNIAHDWQHRAALAGFPSEYDNLFYHAACFIAVVELVLGWIIASYLTVWIIGMIF